MRFLVAVAVLVTAAAGTVCAQRGGAGHGGFSGHVGTAAPGGMRSFGPGRAVGPSRAPLNRGPVSLMPVGRSPYTGIGVQHGGFGPQHVGLGPGQRVGERRTGFSGSRRPYGGPPNGSQPGWGGGDRGRGGNWDHDGDHDRGHHRMPYRPGFGNGYGYGNGISGWYLSPYVLGYPDTFDYDNSNGQYGDNGGNQVPYEDNSGAPGPYGDYGQQQGYGPGPDPGGYQPGYQAPAWQAPQQNRMSYVPLSPAVESAAVAPAPSVTLIFKDGRPPERIHNYLLTSTTLTIVDAPYREIPLDQINMGATEQANQAAGIDFRTPSGTR